MAATHYEGLADKVVLVTGASRGIGRSIALAFAEQDAHVLVNSRTEEAAGETVDAIVAQGGVATPAVADVGDSDTARALVDKIIQDHGRLDVLVNNAGVGAVVPLLEMDQATWEET